MLRVALPRVLRCTSGTVALSTAIVAPVLLLLIFGVTDLGRATYEATSLAAAVRSGTQYALLKPNDHAGIERAVKASSTLSGDKVAVTIRPFCECPNGNLVACTGSCAPDRMRMFVRVSATLPFSKIISTSSIVVPDSLSADAVVRTQ